MQTEDTHDSRTDVGEGPPLDAAPEPAIAAPPEPGTLPDFLDRLATRIGVELIEEMWIFPPRKAGFGDSTVLAVSAFDDDKARRRILTARFNVTKDPKGTPVIEEAIDEHGTAPADRVSRVIEGVLRRLGADDLTASPRHVSVAGDLDVWARVRNG